MASFVHPFHGALRVAGLLVLLLISVRRVQARPLPTMPPVFDRTTVSHLIDAVEEDRNDLILKAGYLARRGSTQLSGEEGLSLLREAVKREPVGTTRWVLLQSLRGYGALRLNKGAQAEGFAAYQLLFEQGQKLRVAGTLGAEDALRLRRSVSEFVNFLPADQLNGAEAAKVDSALTAAFVCWAHLPTPAEGSALTSPAWSRAIAAFGAGGLVEVAKALLDTPETAQNPVLLIGLAEVLQESDGAQAQKLIAHARALLQQGGQQQAKAQLQRLNAQMVAALAAQEKWEEAETLQKQIVQETGEGYATLAVLYSNREERSEVRQKLQEIIKALGSPTAKESEINQVAALLGQWSSEEISKAGLQEVGKSLLRSYLTSARPRDVEQEMMARLQLAKWLVESGRASLAKLDEAAAVLQIKNSSSTMQSRSIQNLAAEMEQLKSKVNQLRTDVRLKFSTASPTVNLRP